MENTDTLYQEDLQGSDNDDQDDDDIVDQDATVAARKKPSKKRKKAADNADNADNADKKAKKQKRKEDKSGKDGSAGGTPIHEQQDLASQKGPQTDDVMAPKPQTLHATTKKYGKAKAKAKATLTTSATTGHNDNAGKGGLKTTETSPATVVAQDASMADVEQRSPVIVEQRSSDTVEQRSPVIEEQRSSDIVEQRLPDIVMIDDMPYVDLDDEKDEDRSSARRAVSQSSKSVTGSGYESETGRETTTTEIRSLTGDTTITIPGMSENADDGTCPVSSSPLTDLDDSRVDLSVPTPRPAPKPQFRPQPNAIAGPSSIGVGDEFFRRARRGKITDKIIEERLSRPKPLPKGRSYKK